MFGDDFPKVRRSESPDGEAVPRLSKNNAGEATLRHPSEVSRSQR